MPPRALRSSSRPGSATTVQFWRLVALPRPWPVHYYPMCDASIDYAEFLFSGGANAAPSAPVAGGNADAAEQGLRPTPQQADRAGDGPPLPDEAQYPEVSATQRRREEFLNDCELDSVRESQPESVRLCCASSFRAPLVAILSDMVSSSHLVLLSP